PGHQLLAGAAIAGDEHTGVARGDQGNALEDHLHRRAAADNLLRGGRFWPRRGVRQFFGGLVSLSFDQRPGHRVQGLVEVEGLGEVIKRPALHGPYGGAEVAESRYDDDWCIPAELP